MLPIAGYVERWSVRAGEEINFMIGVRGGGRYRARIARVICGGPNPPGPGYRGISGSWGPGGEHDGEGPLVATGAWVEISLLALWTGGTAGTFAVANCG